MPTSLLDPLALRNLKSINPILRKILKIKQKCFNLDLVELQFLMIGLMDFRFLKACWSGRLVSIF